MGVLVAWLEFFLPAVQLSSRSLTLFRLSVFELLFSYNMELAGCLFRTLLLRLLLVNLVLFGRLLRFFREFLISGVNSVGSYIGPGGILSSTWGFASWPFVGDEFDAG